MQQKLFFQKFECGIGGVKSVHDKFTMYDEFVVLIVYGLLYRFFTSMKVVRVDLRTYQYSNPHQSLTPFMASILIDTLSRDI